MRFLLDTNRGKSQMASGELTYHVEEVTLDGCRRPQAHIYLGVNKFFSDIAKITCDIGIFEDAKLLRISGGTQEAAVLYELITFSFSINEDRIDEIIAELEANKNVEDNFFERRVR